MSRVKRFFFFVLVIKCSDVSYAHSIHSNTHTHTHAQAVTYIIDLLSFSTNHLLITCSKLSTNFCFLHSPLPFIRHQILFYHGTAQHDKIFKKAWHDGAHKIRNRCLKLFVQRRIHKRQPPSSKTKRKKKMYFQITQPSIKVTLAYNGADVGRRMRLCV